MKRVSSRTVFDPARVFFSMPLAQARPIASRITDSVLSVTGPADPLDLAGQQVLRDALAYELPSLRTDDLLEVGGEIAGTARMLASAKWRAAERPRPSGPTVDPSMLEGALLIHLHAAPDSQPAKIISADWQEHAELFGRQTLWSKPPPQAWIRQARSHVAHASAVYDYWQQLVRAPMV